MDNVIHWGARKEVSTKQSSWYDHSFYEVAFEGEANLTKIGNALRKRVTVQFLSKFGGQKHLGEVKLIEPGKLLVEVLYSIGD